MKKLIIGVIVAMAMASCHTSVYTVGQLSTVSTRNTDFGKKYKLIQKVSLEKRDKKRSNYETVTEAIDATLNKVNGGEYLSNAKIYLVVKDRFIVIKYRFAVDGDVYGLDKN